VEVNVAPIGGREHETTVRRRSDVIAKAVEPSFADTPRCQQAGHPEQREVVTYRRLRQGQRTPQVADVKLAASEQ
jgi:hypothetical protein